MEQLRQRLLSQIEILPGRLESDCWNSRQREVMPISIGNVGLTAHLDFPTKHLSGRSLRAITSATDAMNQAASILTIYFRAHH